MLGRISMKLGSTPLSALDQGLKRGLDIVHLIGKCAQEGKSTLARSFPNLGGSFFGVSRSVENRMKPTATRRNFLMCCASIAALATVLPQSALADDTVTADQFIALSARLTGAAASDLDSAMAGKLLAGFLANGREPGLALLSSDNQVSTGTVADDVVAAWYSGLYDTPSDQAVAGFTDALMWNALDFTKPLGFCGGETGYWAEPPQS